MLPSIPKVFLVFFATTTFSFAQNNLTSNDPTPEPPPSVETVLRIYTSSTKPDRIDAIIDALTNFPDNEEIKQTALANLQAMSSDPEILKLAARDSEFIGAAEKHLLDSDRALFSARQLSVLYGDLFASLPDTSLGTLFLEKLISNPNTQERALLIIRTAWNDSPQTLEKIFSSEKIKSSFQKILSLHDTAVRKQRLVDILEAVYTSANRAGVANSHPLFKDKKFLNLYSKAKTQADENQKKLDSRNVEEDSESKFFESIKLRCIKMLNTFKKQKADS